MMAAFWGEENSLDILNRLPLEGLLPLRATHLKQKLSQIPVEALPYRLSRTFAFLTVQTSGWF